MGYTYYFYRLYTSQLNYYGITRTSVKIRFQAHKSNYNIGNCSCSSKLLFETGEEVKYEILSTFNVDTFDELERIKEMEKEYILNNECVNKSIPTGQFKNDDDKRSYMRDCKRRFDIKVKQQTQFKKVLVELIEVFYINQFNNNLGINIKNKIFTEYIEKINKVKMIINDFMLNLHKQLIERGTTESTATLYIKHLYNLNHQKPFTSLAFLKKVDTIKSILDKYAKSTQLGMLGGILGVLVSIKDKSGYKSLHTKYSNLLKEIKDENGKENPVNEKTDTQEKNWIEWEQVEYLKDQLTKEVLSYGKTISQKQFDRVLQFFILSLYTDIPPRRNKDYLDMVIVKKYNDNMSNDKNYLSIDDKHLIFNSYKTAKTYGKQIIDYSNNKELRFAVELYLKHHPLVKGRMGKSTQIPLLVSYNGSPLNQINSITRILNKIFGKRVGSSMLRHIYLSSKYKDDMGDKETDAEAMAHSVSQQKDYIKKD
jgi:hypothetical protein